MDTPDNNEIEYGFLRAFRSAFEKPFKMFDGVFMYSEKIIFHYTTLEGFVGILKNRGFRLSNPRFLNDAEEVLNGVKLATQLIALLLPKKRYKQFKNVLSKTHEKLLEQKFNKYYVASFSLDGDSLAQWRAYAANGAGISIGFDTGKKTKFPHFSCLPDYYLTKVIYDDREKVKIMLHVVKQYANEYQKDIKKIGARYDDDYADYLVLSLSFFFINFKNSAFSAEQEVRIVLSTQDTDQFGGKEYRISNGLIVPYVCTYNLHIKEPESGNKIKPDPLPISNVVIGPIAHQDAVIESIKTFLSDSGYSNVEVTKSKIPYRG